MTRRPVPWPLRCPKGGESPQHGSSARPLPGAFWPAAAFALVALLASAAPAQAQTGRTLIGLFGNWGAFQVQGGERVCYAISAPTQATRARRSPPYLTVALYPRRGEPQVMVSGGAPLRAARASADGRSFTFRVRGDAGWMAGPNEDAALIAALGSGRSLQVRSQSTRGTTLVDTYALGGFSEAWDAARKACG